jgi:flagellar hook-length control protein FliK
MEPAAPDAVDRRLARMAEDTRQQSQDRRDALAREAESTPRDHVPPRDRAVRETPDKPPAGADKRAAATERPPAPPLRTGHRAEPPAPPPPPSPKTAAETPLTDAGPVADRAVRMRESAATPSPVRAQDPQPLAPPSAASGPVVGPAATTDAGGLARQIGEMLGARPTAETGRPTSAIQSTLASGGTATRDGAAGDRARNAAQPDSPSRPSSRSPQTTTSARAAFDRIVQSIRANIGQRESTARLQLNPPELGRVRIDVRLVQQRLQLEIRTQTEDARETLGGRLDGLRQALAQHGITVERIELASATGDADNTLPGTQGESREQNANDVAEQDEPSSRPRATDDPDEGEEVAPPDIAEWIATSAASEMRLDIRV